MTKCPKCGSERVKPKFFSVDIALDCGIGLEAEGAGTSSDDPKREGFILGHPSIKGLEMKRLVHLPNRLIEEFPEFVQDYVKLLYNAYNLANTK